MTEEKKDKVYHAVVKVQSGDPPRRIVLSAPGIGQAITAMARLCGKGSTAEISEFQLLEVVGRDEYKEVAVKMATKQKPHIRSTAIESDKISSSVVLDDIDEYEEESYKSFSVRVI